MTRRCMTSQGWKAGSEQGLYIYIRRSHGNFTEISESIQVVLDIHRDGVEGRRRILKKEINGKPDCYHHVFKRNQPDSGRPD